MYPYQGVVPSLGQSARKHNMPIENSARSVGDGVVHIVGVYQHGVEGGDTAPCTVAGTL